MTTAKRYNDLSRLKEISSTGTGFAATFDYAYNNANQRTVITNADNSRWVYAYDDLGQVISGKKYWTSDGTPEKERKGKRGQSVSCYISALNARNRLAQNPTFRSNPSSLLW
jgi:YD repeat-containing protein